MVAFLKSSLKVVVKLCSALENTLCSKKFLLLLITVDSAWAVLLIYYSLMRSGPDCDIVCVVTG